MLDRLYGIVPPATTPFTADGDIDLEAFKRQIEWLIASGVHGIAVGGSTGEGHTLDVDECRSLVATAVETSAGRVPIVAGIIVDSTRDAIRRGRHVAGLGAVALQVTPVHYLFRPDDNAMLEHFRVMGEETGQPILIYNVVPWSYLSPALLCRIMTEVPHVVGVKQSAGDLKLFADLMIMARPENLIFSAVDALMYPAYMLGARGSIAAILTAAPRASVALWNAVKTGDHHRARTLHEKLLALWNALNGSNLPACTKHAQTLQDCPALYPRAPMHLPSEAQQNAIQTALKGLE
ncbi:MAG: dihydrodipicolinate synthase family protein [candidate division Zixibacteria bacterium]|nr:dihydrodipicolinate synthase family protein [candidate division Zixibacteria bacterium]